MILKIIIIIFVIFVMFHKYWSKKSSSPYDLTMIFGKMRSGKTTLLQKLCLKYRKKGWNVYSNHALFGAKYFDIKDFGKYTKYQETIEIYKQVIEKRLIR